MRVWICDVCGDQIKTFNETEQEEKQLKNYPDGYFSLEYHPMMLTSDKKPSHFGYRDFCVCDMCGARINKSIFETIAKIKESVYHPTAIIEIDKFPPEPEVMQYTECACIPTARG